jgi:outer membrane protein assembly factor BamB
LTIKADAGKGLWTLSAPEGGLGQPVVCGGSVYLPLSGDRVAAVDAHEGRIRWCSEALTKPAPERLVTVGGAVVVPVLRDRDPGGFTALDTATGKVLWTRRRSELNRLAAAGSTLVLWKDSRDEGVRSPASTR